MPSILVTGASRGMGLEWTRQCAERGWRVYATCRDPFEAGELRRIEESHGTITLHKLDVTDPAQVATLARTLPNASIDVLVHNAGVWKDWDPTLRIGKLKFDAWEETWQVNVLGPVRLTDALVEHVARSERRLVVGITSEMGCVSRITSPGSYAYRASKAALNAALHGMAHELRRRDIGVLLLHPGWVRTTMGGESATLSPAEAVEKMLECVDGFTMEQTGKLFTSAGREMSW
ncbi:MAG: SDR family oxidoreductase [Gammaproteobacteria bacterium]|nr:SDR family oxidoreductase [Gammaproteobacteria bacterium]